MARIGKSRKASGRRRPGVLELLFMASGASAVSLSDFQLITSNSVNFGCILAYNAPIIGCSSKDFTQGHTCSDSCVTGLQVLEMTLETVCDGVNAPDNSILGQALQGNLVDTVCPSGDDSTTSSTTTSKTSTIAIILTSTEKSIPSLTRIPPTTTSSSEDETTSTTETPSELSTIIVETSSTATSADASPAQTSNSAQRTTDTTGARQTSPSSSDKPEATRGGGSPFDATVDNSSSPQLIPAFAQQCVIAFVLGLLLLR